MISPPTPLLSPCQTKIAFGLVHLSVRTYMFKSDNFQLISRSLQFHILLTHKSFFKFCLLSSHTASHICSLNQCQSSFSHEGYETITIPFHLFLSLAAYYAWPQVRFISYCLAATVLLPLLFLVSLVFFFQVHGVHSKVTFNILGRHCWSILETCPSHLKCLPLLLITLWLFVSMQRSLLDIFTTHILLRQLFWYFPYITLYNSTVL